VGGKRESGLSTPMIFQCTISSQLVQLAVSCWDWLNRPRFAPIVLIWRFQHDY